MVKAMLEQARQALLGHALQPFANGTHVANVATALCQSDLVAVVPKGHYLELDLTADGRAWLLSAIEPMVRGKLHEQRTSGALAELRDRLSMGLVG